MSTTQAYERMLRRYGHSVTITRGVDSVTLTAKSVRESEQGLVGNAMQSGLTVRIMHSEIAASALLRPRSKDKITIDGETRTINKVEAIEGVGDVEVVGWRLRVSG